MTSELSSTKVVDNAGPINIIAIANKARYWPRKNFLRFIIG